ncbi:MAG: hypothetical protein ACREFX_13725 [Opitutaceae bacterium]
MIEAFVTAADADLPGFESPAETRQRLREMFPLGATRRMTQLGLLIGGVLHRLRPGEDDALVYASTYAENRTLEEYLASFPNPSPTLFQTSIHPSAIQQALIARRQPVHEIFPLTGASSLLARAARAALLAAGRRAILCGGEERGSSLREHGLASEETFAFAVALERHGGKDFIGRLSLEEDGSVDGALSLSDFAEAIAGRKPLRRAAAPGCTLVLQWR